MLRISECARLAGVLVGFFLMACSGDPIFLSEPADDSPEPLTPSDYDPPIAFQHGDLVLGSIVFNECYGWREALIPTAGPVTVDLVFPFGPHGDPRDPTPKAVDAQAVEDVGGEIIKVFDVSMIRAKLPRESLAAIENYDRLDHARAVPDPSRSDVRMIIGAGSHEDEVKSRFQELGGYVTDHWDRIDAFRGVIANDSIPAIRALGMGSKIKYIELDFLTCVW